MDVFLIDCNFIIPGTASTYDVDMPVAVDDDNHIVLFFYFPQYRVANFFVSDFGLDFDPFIRQQAHARNDPKATGGEK